MNVMTLGVGALELLGVLVGFALGRVARSNRRPRPPSYRCACDHVLSYHDDEGCHATEDNWKGQPVRCQCRRYVGDQPPPQLDEIMRDIGGSL